jgi:2-iminobutanoate/2-iminopropanoate deaminase
MIIRPVTTQLAPTAIGPYSQAVECHNFLFCSGQIPVDPTTGTLVTGGITAQMEQIMKNLSNILIAGGSNLNHVVKATVFMVDLAGYKEMNEVYTRYLGSNKPARSTVQVAALPMGALVELEVIAVVVEKRLS